METGSQLDKPLGQDRRKKQPGSRPRGSLRSWLAVAAAALVVIGAGFIALQQNPLRQPTKTAQSDPTEQQQTTETLPVVIEGGKTEDGRIAGDSGADVQRTLTDDGQVVTTISPIDRTGDGPLIISGAETIGQDPRVAHLPVPELLEKTDFGRLPVKSASGHRPFDAYARPWSGARGTRLAIVVGGLGLSQTGTQYAIATLPEEITLAFAATGNSLQRWLQEARRGGHEVLLQVPFEPFNYPQNNPGPHTLLIEDGPQQNLADLHWAMGRITNYTGIMNFMGARFLSDQKATETVMRDLARRGVLFLDDGTSARTVTEPIAGAVGVPHAQADIVVDGKVGRADILKKLDDAERIARRNGSAIAVASAFEASVDAIAAWANEAKARGIEIVSVSALANDPEDL
ncbi:divergent polysaccharide deacetylase family protein [Hoeflea poritis]|uniref:Divergent polysaccharide deacetylase family protein n=1 Tax=Hoeflea poritis TaxID=2993659 RepID=A0ABT4VLN2_9HYPH|nr:divergent polysaccharide deacetylase family protein [Hoeflea poritis]MDA4845623.1 divergent polysaccharide deacetylase family protein [Hoeflea poritis]